MQVVLYAPLFRSGMTLELQKCLTELSAFSGLGRERCDNYERLAAHIDFSTLPEMDSQKKQIPVLSPIVHRRPWHLSSSLGIAAFAPSATHPPGVDKDRFGPTELANAGGDLVELRVGVRARISRERRQRGHIHTLDAVALGDHGNLMGGTLEVET